MEDENKVLDKSISDSFFNTHKDKYCADCSRPSPVWVSISFGVFLCSDCASKHRALGVTVSKIKSILLDSWTLGELRRIFVSGNRMIVELGDTKDIRLKYTKGEKYKEKLNLLCKENSKREPGLSFLKSKSEIKVVASEVRRVPLPKFGDEIGEGTTGEIGEGTTESTSINSKLENNITKPSIDKKKTFVVRKKDTPSIKRSPVYDVGGVESSRLGFRQKENEK